MVCVQQCFAVRFVLARLVFWYFSVFQNCVLRCCAVNFYARINFWFWFCICILFFCIFMLSTPFACSDRSLSCVFAGLGLAYFCSSVCHGVRFAVLIVLCHFLFCEVLAFPVTAFERFNLCRFSLRMLQCFIVSLVLSVIPCVCQFRGSNAGAHFVALVGRVCCCVSLHFVL